MQTITIPLRRRNSLAYLMLSILKVLSNKLPMNLHSSHFNTSLNPQPTYISLLLRQRILERAIERSMRLELIQGITQESTLTS